MGPKSVNYIDFNFYSKINSYDEQSYFWVCFQANNFFEFIIELETMLRFDISIFNIKKNQILYLVW
jgi:hypothetical protein